jgi:hypothetical protein
VAGTILELGHEALDALGWLPCEALADFPCRAVLEAARRLDRPASFDRARWFEAIAVELDRAGYLEHVGLAELHRLGLEHALGLSGIWHFAQKTLEMHLRRELVIALEDARGALLDSTPVRQVLAALEAAGQGARDLARSFAAAEAAHPDRRVHP